MRILLQNVRSKLFFRGGDTWTSDPDAAFDFQHSQDLYDFVDQQKLEGMQLVVKFSNPLQFEVVPIEGPIPHTVSRHDPS